jgi:hypothetical protein
MLRCLGSAAVQVEEVVESVEAVVLVGSSSGPPSQSPLVPPLQWWWGVVEREVHFEILAFRFPLPVATLPLVTWWPLVGEQALSPIVSPVAALVEGVPLH